MKSKFEILKETISNYVPEASIQKGNLEDAIRIRFFDPVAGNVWIEAYVHSDNFVVTSWDDVPNRDAMWGDKSSLVYTPCEETFIREVAAYFSDPNTWYKEQYLKAFIPIVDATNNFVSKFGVKKLKQLSNEELDVPMDTIHGLNYIIEMCRLRKSVIERIARDAVLDSRM